jgi:hypothetical protein
MLLPTPRRLLTLPRVNLDLGARAAIVRTPGQHHDQVIPRDALSMRFLAA